MLPINYLKAALLFTARNDVRYYLNSVYITPDAIAATDGRRAIQIMYTTGIATPAIVPSEHIQHAIKSAPKKTAVLPIANARISPVTEGVQLGTAVYPTIDSKYPDVDATILGSAKGYAPGDTRLKCDWQYLVDCQEAARLVAKHIGYGSVWCTYDLPTSRVLPHPDLRDILQMIVMRMQMTEVMSS